MISLDATNYTFKYNTSAHNCSQSHNVNLSTNLQRVKNSEEILESKRVTVERQYSKQPRDPQ